MSIPYIFTPQRHQGRRTYDGGVQNNFPVRQLLADEPGTPFLSLFLGREVFEPEEETLVLFELVSIGLEGADDEIVAEHRPQTVIIDPRPIRTLDFELSDAEKEYLLVSGRLGATKHLAASYSAKVEAVEAGDSDVADIAMDALQLRKRTEQLNAQVEEHSRQKAELRAEVEEVRATRQAKKDAIKAKRMRIAKGIAAVVFVALLLLSWGFVEAIIEVFRRLTSHSLGWATAAVMVAAAACFFLLGRTSWRWKPILRSVTLMLTLVSACHLAAIGLGWCVEDPVSRVVGRATVNGQPITEGTVTLIVGNKESRYSLRGDDGKFVFRNVNTNLLPDAKLRFTIDKPISKTFEAIEFDHTDKNLTIKLLAEKPRVLDLESDIAQFISEDLARNGVVSRSRSVFCTGEERIVSFEVVNETGRAGVHSEEFKFTEGDKRYTIGVRFVGQFPRLVVDPEKKIRMKGVIKNVRNDGALFYAHVEMSDCELVE